MSLVDSMKAPRPMGIIYGDEEWMDEFVELDSETSSEDTDTDVTKELNEEGDTNEYQ